MQRVALVLFVAATAACGGSSLPEVPDGESVVPAIDTALKLYEESDGIAEANREQLDRWLDSGAYSRQRREPLDRFMGQLDAA